MRNSKFLINFGEYLSFIQFVEDFEIIEDISILLLGGVF